MAENFLKQLGYDINDNQFEELGITDADIAGGNFNRKMFDIAHAENVAGYMSQGMSESEAKHKADKQRSMAIKAAKKAGLQM